LSVLAIVPARSGSKGIPNKNWKPLCGTTPVRRAVNCARAVRSIDVIAVSTDIGPQLEQHPSAIGVQRVTIVHRPPELAQDDTPMIDVVKHVLAQIPGEPDQKIVLLQPTQPLREPKHITAALELLTPEVDSVVSVVEAESPHRMHTIENGRLYTWNAIYAVERRQDAKPAWKRDGTAYCFWRRTVHEHGDIYGDVCVPLIIPASESQALDTELDWIEAERRLRERG
jgi:CMP-N,N'-diacetyllegionaminic acid synthase